MHMQAMELFTRSLSLRPDDYTHSQVKAPWCWITWTLHMFADILHTQSGRSNNIHVQSHGHCIYMFVTHKEINTFFWHCYAVCVSGGGYMPLRKRFISHGKYVFLKFLRCLRRRLHAVTWNVTKMLYITLRKLFNWILQREYTIWMLEWWVIVRVSTCILYIHKYMYYIYIHIYIYMYIYTQTYVDLSIAYIGLSSRFQGILESIVV